MDARIRRRGSHRKIIFIFILAILLPSLVVGYLSLNTVLQRRDAVQRLLESNLWMSGDAALERCERLLLDQESALLSRGRFSALYLPKQNVQGFVDSTLSPGTPRPFLLDSQFRIVYPETVRFFERRSIQEEELDPLLRKAEHLEFYERNYLEASTKYDTFLRSAPFQQRSIALEGLSRCLLALKRYSGASEVNQRLVDQYGQMNNRAGHPYGITGSLQLAELERRRGLKEASIRRLLTLYEDIIQGAWGLNASSYAFFESEVEAGIEVGLEGESFPELQEKYEALSRGPRPYQDRLHFAGDIESHAVPSIREKTVWIQDIRDNRIERFTAVFDSAYHLISFLPFPNFIGSQTFHAGLDWQLDAFRIYIMEPFLGGLSQDSGLEFELTPDNEDVKSEQAHSLSFRSIPLPWKLVVTQTGMTQVESAARREIFLYGSLLTVIILLMVFGAFLIARDMAREAETTRLKTEFVHNISHELKTPLTLIRLYGETLERKKNLSDKDRKESYQIITKESERLSHMVNNVLDFSRIDMGRKEFHMKRGNFAEVVQETLDSYQYHLNKKQFIVHSEITSDLPEMAFDREAMVSVLVNLLSNAMKFSPNKREVSVRLAGKETAALLEVSDKGIGIAPNEQKRIFQRFYRSKDGRVSETGGSGLGLPLVKHIVEAHGGRVEVVSQLGEGSTFSVILPFSIQKRIEE